MEAWKLYFRSDPKRGLQRTTKRGHEGTRVFRQAIHGREKRRRRGKITRRKDQSEITQEQDNITR